MSQQHEARWQKPKMVGWYDPLQLVQTGLRTLLSTLLGSMIDTRRFAAAEGKDEDCIIEAFARREEVWFDYMADTGDGWDSTFTMAYLLSAPRIRLNTGAELPRADFVILGGDEVYPVASKMAYAQRLVWPFNEAARRLGQYGDASHLRDLYCIPGNHDWYDSLAAFTRRFCNGRRIGCFQTRQTRSYFVLKLPYNWQIWAIDIQLAHDIDVPQFNFFRKHASSLDPGARVILCLAEPDWVYGKQAGEDLHFNVERFERLADKKGKMPLQLAGDVHNYQRYEGTREPGEGYAPYQQTKLVSGGGGAFLHPTHTLVETTEDPKGFRFQNRFPDAQKSRRLSLWDIFFAVNNWKMSALLGVLYLLLFWSVPRNATLLTYPIDHPGSFLLILIVLASLWRFADLNGLKKLAWGLMHGAAHVCLAILIWYWAPHLWPQSWLIYPVLQIYLPRVCVFLLGGLMGGTLFGLYLLVSLNLLGIHKNEAFAALRIPDYKHFLRCHLTADGLKIHVIGVNKVALDKQPHPVSTHIVEELSIQ